MRSRSEHGVRSSVVRVPPITHSTLDRHGFARSLIAIARQTRVAGYPGDGANRWPAGHTLDVGHLYRLALEDAPAGTRWHAVGDEGIPMREIAQSIGDHLGIPTASIPDDRLQAHFGFLAMVIAIGAHSMERHLPGMIRTAIIPISCSAAGRTAAGILCGNPEGSDEA